MGYMHIENSYREAVWTQFLAKHPKVYALEKIDGTSAHVRYKREDDGEKKIIYFSGGSNRDQFVALFDESDLIKTFDRFFDEIYVEDDPENEYYPKSCKMVDMTLFGEAYGAKVQGLSERYGKTLKFIVFDVLVKFDDGTEYWWPVPVARKVAVEDFNLEFVDYTVVDLTVSALDAEMMKPSVQAQRNGMGEHRSEGVVVRPLEEDLDRYGRRLIMKHKHPDERERKSKIAPSMDPEKLAILTESQQIADEWVVEKRLEHVLGKLNFSDPTSPKNIPAVIEAMQEDVKREAEGEIEWNKDTERAIGKATSRLYLAYIKKLTQGPQR